MVFGTIVTAPLVVLGVGAIPQTGGTSLILLPIAVAVDYIAAGYLDKIQNSIYQKLEIK